MSAVLMSAPANFVPASKLEPAPRTAAPPPQPEKTKAPQQAPTPPQPKPQTEPPKPDTRDTEKAARMAQQQAEEKAKQEEQERKRKEQVLLEEKRKQEEIERKERLRQQQLEQQKELDKIRQQREEAERKRKREQEKLKQIEDMKKAQVADATPTPATKPAVQAGNYGVDNSLQARYKLAIQQTVDSNWNRPDSLPARVMCHVTVIQIVGGEVINVDLTDCPFDQVGRRSVEAAVTRQPLPYTGFETVFQRQVRIPFCYPREECAQ
ncbi:protein TolA [Pseudomarimonas arenosa]|uniref:Protein TolA n=1 Tax=Pseudomarimonas arenosa TaxID=2774145 RepID=A0AAW3ZHG6_9GAMM|nr:protein TolA [Pseudomarimonas arenosa]MBD8524152.1 protein TolA [Pseudomarimonas arenosa]